MSEPPIQSFAEFWPYYVGAHQNPLNRACHYVGTSSAVGSTVAAVLTGQLSYLLLVPLVGYVPAWLGHFLIEGNRPATFGHPRYSLMADFKMLGYALRGKMAAEAARLRSSKVAFQGDGVLFEHMPGNQSQPESDRASDRHDADSA